MAKKRRLPENIPPVERLLKEVFPHYRLSRCVIEVDGKTITLSQALDMAFEVLCLSKKGDAEARNREIAKLRFGLKSDGKRMKLDDVGEREGLSGEMIRIIEESAVCQLRDSPLSGMLKQFLTYEP